MGRRNGDTEMTYCTDRQAAFIRSLAAQAGFASDVAAITEYGFGILTASSLSARQASEMITALKGGLTPRVEAAPVELTVGGTASHPMIPGRVMVLSIVGSLVEIKDAAGRVMKFPRDMLAA